MESLKIWYHKKRLKKWYLKLWYLSNVYDCGNELIEYLTDRVSSVKGKFDYHYEWLRENDPDFRELRFLSYIPTFKALEDQINV